MAEEGHEPTSDQVNMNKEEYPHLVELGLVHRITQTI